MNTGASKTILPGWLKVLLAGLAVFIVLLGMTLTIAYVALRSNPERLEPLLETITTWVLDRELIIGELLEVELGLNTYVLAQDVSLANPAWADEPHFVRAGRLLFRINLPSIWQAGAIIIDEVEARDVVVSVLIPEAHPPNWDFWPVAGSVPIAEPEPIASDVLAAVFPVMVRKGYVEKGILIYRDQERDIEVVIDQLRLQEPPDASLLNLDLAGSIDEMPLSVAGQIGPVASLMTQRDLKMNLALSWGELSIQSTGSIANLVDLSGPDLNLQIAAPRSRPLLDLLGLEEVRDGPLLFSGQVTDAAPGLAIEAEGSISDFDLAVSGSVLKPLQADDIDLVFMIDGPSLAEAGAAFNVEGLPGVPYGISGTVYRSGSLLSLSHGVIKAGNGEITLAGKLPQFPSIDDWELALEGHNLDFTVLGPLVGATELPPIEYHLEGGLASNDQGVELMELAVSSSRGRLILDGVVGQGPEYFGSRLDIDHEGYDLGTTARWLGVEGLPHVRFGIKGEIGFDDKGWQFRDIALSTTDVALMLSGSLDSLPQPELLQGSVQLSSPGVASVLETWGYPVEGLPDYPLQAGTRIGGSLEALKLTQGSIVSGESRVAFSGNIGQLTDNPQVALAIEFLTPDLFDLLPSVSDDDLPGLHFEGRGGVGYSDSRVEFDDLAGRIGGASFSLAGQLDPLALLQNSNSKLRIEGPSLREVLGPWVEQPMPDVPFKLVVDAKLDEGQARVDRLEFTTADARLFAQIDIEDPANLTSATGELEFSGPSSQNLITLFGGDVEVPDESYKLSAVVERNPDWLRLNPISLDWGKSDYGGKVDVRLGEVPVIDADLHSEFLSLSFFLPDFEELEREEAAQQDISDELEQFKLPEMLTSEERAQRVIPNEPLDFSWMHGVDVSLRYKADVLHFKDGVNTEALFDFSVSKGVLKTREMSWDGSFSRGKADLTLTALESGVAAEADLDITRLPLIVFMGGEPIHDPDARYRLRMKSNGGSFRELAKRANGALLFQGGGGVIDNKGMDLILGDVLEEVTARLNPFGDTDPQTIIECHAGAINVVDGKVNIAPGLVLRTNKMDMAAGGTVDLHKEALNITFNTKSRKGVGISAGKAITPYFKVGGTMANPRLAIDPKGVALSGGAAVATAGLSILAESMWDRWVATASNPCERMFTAASEKDKRIYGSLVKKE